MTTKRRSMGNIITPTAERPDPEALCGHTEWHNRHLIQEISDRDTYYRYVFDNVNDAIHIHDLAGRFLDVNQVACRRLGYTREELLSMEVKQLDTPENAARYDDAMQAFLQTGSIVLESCHRRKDSTCIPVEISARLIEFKGQPAVLSVVRDISERKWAEAKIQKQNEKLADLVAQIEEHDKQLAVSTELVHIVSSARTLDDIFPVFTEQARRLVAYDRISIYLHDPPTQQFIVRLMLDECDNGPQPGTRVPCDKSLVEFIQANRQPIVCPTPDGHELYPIAQRLADQMSVLTAITMPLMIQDRFLGVFGISRRRGPLFRQADAQMLLPVAKQLAIAIENARLQEQIQVMAIREERDRLGREMHDGLGQVLGHIAMQAAAAAELLRQGQVDQAQAMMEELTGVAQTAYVDVREAILGLRDSGHETVGLETALREYLHRYQREWGIVCELQIADGMLTACERREEIQLFRIIQEALTNVRKHARASRVWLRLACEGEWQTVAVVDNGCGFDPSIGQVGHFGLETMCERAESIGGQLRVESAPGAGTRVIISLPCCKAHGSHA